MIDENKRNQHNDETLLKFEQFLKTKTKIDQNLLKLIFDERVMESFKNFGGTNDEQPSELPNTEVIGRNIGMGQWATNLRFNQKVLSAILI